MSLINQMLRDLQQRQGGGRPAVPATAPARRSKRSRRRFSVAKVLGSVPPLLWVGVGGVAGLALLWGAFVWLSGVLGPNAPAPVLQPPAEMVAIAKSPPPAIAETPVAGRRRAPSVPIDVPPPSAPLAYGSSAPAGVVPPVAVTPSAEPASASVRSAPTVVLPRPSSTYFSDQPLPVASSAPARPVLPSSWSRGAAAGPVSAAPVEPRIPGVAVSPPGRLHPDLLPGAVNSTNLALQKAAREVTAAPPPVATPYGRAEEAYREGRQAYDANRIDASLEALRRALELYPGHLPARELLADQLEMNGQADEAQALLTQGLTIAPDYAPFRKRVARMLLDRGDAAGAIRALTGNGLPRVEDDAELHRMLAGIYRQLGENFLAAQTYRNLLIHDPQDGACWLGLGESLAADGQPLEARKAYRRALAAGRLSREEEARARTGSERL